MNNSSSSTGTGSFAGDMLVLLLMVVGGTALVVWLSTLQTDELTKVLTGTSNFFMLLWVVVLVYPISKIIFNEELPIKRRIYFGLLAFVAAGIITALIRAGFVYGNEGLVEYMNYVHQANGLKH